MALPDMGALWMTTFDSNKDLQQQLIASAQAGDSDAFGHLMTLHGRTVLRVAERVLLDADEAKDVAQDVFLRLHRSLKGFDKEQELGPWLYRITLNLCRDRLRRAKRDIRIDTLNLLAQPDAEQSLLDQQRRHLAQRALAELTPKEREAIVLRDFEGKSTKEVADILGSTETTVRSQLSTGRSKMKDFIVAFTNRRQP